MNRTTRSGSCAIGFALVAMLGGTVLPQPHTADAAAASIEVKDQQIHDPVFPDVGRMDLDVSHYDLSLRWQSNSRTLSGREVIDVAARFDTKPLSLDLSHWLAASSVSVDGRIAHFEQRGNTLFIGRHDLVGGVQHVVKIAYRGQPHSVPFPGSRGDIPALGWTNEPHGEAWSMQEPYGAFTWYPVNDHLSDKATYNISIAVPVGQVGISGGDMTKQPTRVGNRIKTAFRLDEPTASYLTTIAIGAYRDAVPTAKLETAFDYWIPKGQKEAVRLKVLQSSPELLDMLTSHLGPLPFSHEGVVVVPSDSAMETQELITMGTGRLQSRQDALDVIYHEFAHQWYGDMVTPRTWDDLWMNEGFAMYLELGYWAGGDPQAMDQLHNWLASNDQHLRNKYGPPGDFKNGEWGSDNVYYCTALMLFELREKVGATTFDALIRDWPQEHNGQTVDRDDYIDWVSAQVGTNMRPFFEKWLTSKTTPKGAGVGDRA